MFILTLLLLVPLALDLSTTEQALDASESEDPSPPPPDSEIGAPPGPAFTAGDDIWTGTNQAETVNAGGGADILDANGGDDLVFGGAGIDDIAGGQGDDLIFGEAGDDLLIGEQGEDTLDGGPGDDRIQGRLGDDLLLGNAGLDRVFGGDGDDLVTGGTGSDTVSGGAGDDLVFGGALTETPLSIDQLRTLSDASTLPTTAGALLPDDGEADRLFGGPGFDIVYLGANDEGTGGADGDGFLLAPETRGAFATITDFTPGSDVLVISSPANAPINEVIGANTGTDLLLSAPDGSALALLLGVQEADIRSGDIQFETISPIGLGG